MLDNVLVLSPHMDDECLGVGGTLFHCNNIHIHYFNNYHPTVPQEKYAGEAQAVAKELHCSVSYTNFTADIISSANMTITTPSVNRMHMNPIMWYISEIEELVNKQKPDTIFIPARSRNQDHRVVYDAAITACRFHDTNYLVPNVLIYEQNEYMPHDFVPNFFVPIDIDKKLELFSLYQSQQRGHRKPEHIKALATLRGMEINEPYAEAFMVVRQKWGNI